MSTNNTSGKGAGMATTTQPPSNTALTILPKAKTEEKKEAAPKPLAEVLEIIAKNFKYVQERGLLQKAIDELKEISFSSNSKICLIIKDEAKDYNTREHFNTYNMKAINICVVTLIQAFESKKTEIENSISLN